MVFFSKYLIILAFLHHMVKKFNEYLTNTWAFGWTISLCSEYMIFNLIGIKDSYSYF